MHLNEPERVLYAQSKRHEQGAINHHSVIVCVCVLDGKLTVSLSSFQDRD